MNILIHLRSDSAVKPGGDSSLMRRFGELLKANANTVEFTLQPSCSQGQFDLALTANLDRPFEVAQFVRSCKSAKVPVILYSLHHPRSGVKRYLEHGTQGFRRVLACLALFNPSRYESLLATVKFVMGRVQIGSMSACLFLATKYAQRYLLENVECILASTAAEKREIVNNFGAEFEQKIRLVPHIIGTGSESSVGRAPDIDVICAGRIESRKNQLLVAKLARLMPELSFVFVGSAFSGERRYFSEFCREIADLPNVTHYESVSLEALRGLFRRSRIFVSLSWFEVVSLTEMEALNCGCRLIVGRYSYAQQYGQGLTTFVEPNDLNATKGAISDVLTSQSSPSDEELKALRNRLNDMGTDNVEHALLAVIREFGVEK